MKAELVLGNLKREREALNGKLERLLDALNKDWQDADQEYLCSQQYNAMSLYAHILDERILDIEMKLEEKKMAMKDINSHETCHNKEYIFNKNIDLGSYKKDMDNTPERQECECDVCDLTDDIIDILEEVFDIKIIR